MSNGISKKKVLEIISKNGQKCNYCSRELESYEVFVDHVVPKYRGGKNEISNLVICCSYCNSSKGKKTLEQFNIHKSLKEISNGFDVSFGDSGLMIKTKTTNLEENINILQSVVSHIKTLLL